MSASDTTNRAPAMPAERSPARASPSSTASVGGANSRAYTSLAASMWLIAG